MGHSGGSVKAAGPNWRRVRLHGKKLLLRNARPDELDSVSPLIRYAYEQYESLLSPEAWKSYVEDMMNVRGRFDEAELILAELGGQLAGAVTLYLDAGHSSQQLWPGGGAGA